MTFRQELETALSFSRAEHNPYAPFTDENGAWNEGFCTAWEIVTAALVARRGYPTNSRGARQRSTNPLADRGEKSADDVLNALRPFAALRADDGDTFDSYPAATILRCEVTVGEIKRARIALAAATQRAKTPKAVECEASQSGAAKTAQRPTPVASSDKERE